MDDESRLSENDAQEAILNNPYLKELKDAVPPSVWAKKVAELLEAQEIKVFHHEGFLSYSTPLNDNATQRDVAKWLGGVMGVVPKTGVKVEGAGGVTVIIDADYSGKEQGDEEA